MTRRAAKPKAKAMPALANPLLRQEQLLLRAHIHLGRDNPPEGKETLTSFCNRSGISRTTVLKHLHDEVLNPSTKTINMAAKVLGYAVKFIKIGDKR